MQVGRCAWAFEIGVAFLWGGSMNHLSECVFFVADVGSQRRLFVDFVPPCTAGEKSALVN